jgi:hypothetical protein
MDPGSGTPGVVVRVGGGVGAALLDETADEWAGEPVAAAGAASDADPSALQPGAASSSTAAARLRAGARVTGQE